MSQTVDLKVAMSCQGCVGAVKRVLDKMEGVETYDINLQAKKVTVKGNVKPDEVLQAVSKTGKKTAFWDEPTAEAEAKPTEAAPVETEAKLAKPAPAEPDAKPTEAALKETEAKPAEAAPVKTEAKPAEAAPKEAEAKSTEAAPADSEPKAAEATGTVAAA